MIAKPIFITPKKTVPGVTLYGGFQFSHVVLLIDSNQAAAEHAHNPEH